MLRRRHKTPKVQSPPREGGTARTPRSRRRAREGAVVPPDLRIQAQHRAPATQAKVPDKAPVQAKVPDKARVQPKQPAPKPSRREGAPTRAPREAAPSSAPRVVLVTGFEPFGGDEINPSWDVCGQLPREIAGLRVETLRVPCQFRRAIETVAAAVERHRPGLVISLGLAAGRTHMGVERVAINVDDARIADNGGAQPVDQPTAANGPPAYFATLPVKAMVAAMHEQRVPAEVSNSAGTFVCNHLMYGVLHFIAAKGLAVRAGFIHVPCSEAMVLTRRDVPSMSVATMARGVEAAIAAAHTHSEDIAAAGGTLD